MFWWTEFKNDGVPVTGLTGAVINIWRIDTDTLLVSGAIMIEVGNGIYKYNHTGYERTIPYVARCDGGSPVPDTFRYTYGSNEDDLLLAFKIPDENFMGSSVKSSKDDEIDAILVDTGTTLPAQITSAESNIIAEIDANETKIDNLQTDITDILADTNEIQGKLPTNNIMGSSDKSDKDDEIDAILVDTGTTLPATLSTMDGKLDNIQVDLDNPDQYKADVSALATEANATANKNEVITEVNANETKIDSIITTLASVALEASVQALISALNIVDGNVDRILGLTHDNVVVEHTYTDVNNTGATVYIYNSKANALTHDKVTGLLFKYTMDATYSGLLPTLHRMVRDS